MTELSDDDKAMLDLAFAHYAHGGAREAAVRERWGISSVRYWQRVDWLLEQPDALAYDPINTRRLLRLREARRAARSAH